MIQVVCVRNPFDPLASREIRKIRSGQQIRELVRGFNVHPGYDVAVSVDGRVLTSPEKMEHIPRAGSCVVFCAIPQGGGGKNPVAIVAMLAVLVAAPVAAPALLEWVGGMAFTGGWVAGTATIAATQVGMVVAGGMIVSAVFPVSTPSMSGPAAIDNSPTYSWKTGTNSVIEGSVLPEIFGTHRVVPPLIGHFIETAGGINQCLNLLFAVAGHPVDSITSVRINDTAIESFGGVNLPPETRPGSHTQEVIQYFNDTRFDTLVNSELTTDVWATRSTSGNSVTGIGVTIGFPRGLFRAKSDGGIGAYEVRIYIEYRITGSGDEVPWTRLTTLNKTTEVVTTGHWSGGYWDNSEGQYSGMWVQLEEWDTTPPTPVEGQPYESDIWIYDGEQGTSYRRILIWHWVEQTTIVVAGSEERDYYAYNFNEVRPFHQYEYKDGLPANQYDVRMKLVSAIEESSTVFADTYFEALTEITPDDFRYPGTALLAIRAVANEQLSGNMPRVDCLVTRSTVPVWQGASYVQFPATNPAWVCYHLLHQARYKGSGDTSLAENYEILGVPADRIDFWSFVSWAGWCDNPAGDFSLAPHTCNIYFDSAYSLRKALDIAGSCGRGSVVQIGSKFTCIIDRPEITPVQRFLLTPGNIAAGSFTETFLPMQDRANAIEMTYYDAEQDYSRQTLEIYAGDYDTSDREINKASVTLLGVTSRQKSIDYARFLLNSNRYLTNTITIDVGVDALACIPGDIIEVAHDVPQWGYGGRVVSATTNTITLDRTVTIAGGTTYHIMVKHQDDDSREEKTVTTGAGDHTTLSISGTWTKIPALHAIYSFGEVDRVVKEFRVLRIGHAQDMNRKITAIEYLQEVFEDGATIPEPTNPSDLAFTSNLVAAEVYRGGSETRVYLTWRGVAPYWNVYIRKSGQGWTFYREAYKPTMEIAGLEYGVLYEFGVTHTEDPSDGETVSITLRGKIDPPGRVPFGSLTATQSGYSMVIEWGAVDDFDLWGYELRVEKLPDPLPDMYMSYWINATRLFKGNARSYTWVYEAAGNYCLHVVAVDAFGNVSTDSTKKTITISAPIITTNQPTFSGPNVILSWNAPVNSAFAVDHYNIYYGMVFGSAISVGTTKSTTFSINVTWGGTRRYWITAVDVAMNEGSEVSIDVDVIQPGAVGALTPRVIDNNVLLYWNAPTQGSLPIAYYEVSKGDSYQTSEEIGTVLGTFTTIFEEAAGSFVYWIRAVDTAFPSSQSESNKGTPAAIPAIVNQPPDYELLIDWASDLSGDVDDAILEDGILYAPVDISETYQGHFTTHGYNTPQDQIDDEKPAWIMPVPTTATYTEIFDYGSVINPTTKISVEMSQDESRIWGTVTITPSIEVSTDGETWETPVEAWSILAASFRYVRIILTFTGSGGDDIAAVNNLRIKLDLKQIDDAGRVEVTTNGLQVDFNKSFIDIISITVTAEGTTALFAIYDFTDAPNPTHFHVYLFDAAGNDASGSGKYISWAARGI